MRSSIMDLIFLLCMINLISCFDENKGKRFGAYSYATYCDPDRLSKWDVGQIGLDYPDITDIVVV